MTRFAVATDIFAAAGTDLGTTGWRTVTATDVGHFAAGTGGDGWIHTDADRAREHGPFGRPVVQGYLTLALATPFLTELLDVEGYGLGVNYGLDRVRFPAAVPVGSRVRARGLLLSAQGLPPAIRTVVELRYECDATARPPCVAQIVSLLLPAPPPTVR